MTQSVRSTRLGGPFLPQGLLAPAIGVLALALAYPLGRQVLMSLQEYGLAQQFGEPAEWVGLANYRALVTDSYLWGVVARSVAFCLVNAAVTMALGVAVAVLLTTVSKVVRLITQIGLLLAWAMPVLAVLTVWQWMFDTQYGVVNWLLSQGGLVQFQGHSWLIEPLSFYLVATIIVVWMSVPFVVFTVYAGLMQVPAETVEAAQIDGAGAWQRFRHVVVPAIRPVLLVVGLLQVIWDLRVFTQIYVLQEAGGVSRETNLIGTYVYRLGIAEGDFGTASAVAIFMLALTVLLTFGYVRRMLRAEGP
ncbi:MAG TPA: sugar ABC transporter permease [Actinomycetales bacterium]|nr:sugar ABC transporter permease [Actinomycetales bacterium]